MGTWDARAARRLLTLAMIATATACADPSVIPPLPPDAPARLAPDEIAEVEGRPLSHMLVAAGEPALSPESVAVGGAIATVPFRFRHTAVLTKDLRGYSMAVRGIQAPKGSPGYFAGVFPNVGATLTVDPEPQELWCFLPDVAGGTRDPLCVLKGGTGIAAVAPPSESRYLRTRVSADDPLEYVRTPIYERREVEIPGDLMLEYRFEGWVRNNARIGEYAVGREVKSFEVEREPDGSAVFSTLWGDVQVRSDPTDPARAVAELIPPAAPAG